MSSSRTEWADELRPLVAALLGVSVSELTPRHEAKVQRLVALLESEIAEAAQQRMGTKNEERIEEILITFIERFRRALLDPSARAGD